MKKICDGFYRYRGKDILVDEQGIYIDWAIQPLNLYKTLTDAKEFINQMIDGTNKRQPRIVGQWHE